jgi:tripartite-type tricarboxylate transporter receptor subunit TctC
MGVLAPAQTDPAVVQALYRAIAAFTQQPDFRQQLQADGTDVVGSDPPTFTRQIQAELRQWAEVVKKAQIKAE